MNYVVTKYPQGTFSWANVCTKNSEATKAFYTGLFGWTATDMPSGQPGVNFTIFSLDGKSTAGAGPMPPHMPDAPSFWANFITVDDMDATLAHAEKLGAKITEPAMDVPGDGGRIGGIEDPEGAYLMFWQPKKIIGAQIVNTVGAMCWNELYTRDAEAAKKFYGELFHWTFESSKDGDSTYIVIKNNGRSNGGIMPITKEMGPMPAKWMVYFTVKNLSESLAKVKELGGKVYMDKPVSTGKIGIVADPNEAGLVLIELSVPPDEWKE